MAYLRTAINSKTTTSRQRSRKRTVFSVASKDTSSKDKKMTSCNGVSLKNVDKRINTEELLKSGEVGPASVSFGGKLLKHTPR